MQTTGLEKPKSQKTHKPKEVNLILDFQTRMFVVTGCENA